MSYTLHHGDCIGVMRTLPAESVDAIVTSPPYAEQRKSTYGGIPEAEYPEWTVAWMAEARRLLKSDGSVIINIRPNVKDGGISDYVLRSRLALRDAGWIEIEELIWDKVSGPPLGAVKRPRRSWESLLWYGKHGRIYCDPKAGGVVSSGVGYGGNKAGRYGWDHEHTDGRWVANTTTTARVTDVIKIHPRNNPDDNAHPAPFPPKLAEWCGKLICPPGGTILDPFNGSASTGVAAIRNGWDYIGIDAVQEYIDMSHVRLARQLGEAA